MVHICSAFAMRRSDKQPDRVEISPEQLSAAAIKAEVSTLCSMSLSHCLWRAGVPLCRNSALQLDLFLFLDAHAQQLAANLQRPIQVLGWYHSHPHITVWPSHVGKSEFHVTIPVPTGLPWCCCYNINFIAWYRREYTSQLSAP